MKQIIVFLLFTVIIFIGCSNGDKNAISASGTIETTEVTVGAKVGGQIQRLYVDEGAQIKQGDTLLLIDRSDLEIQLMQAVASADAATAQYTLAVRGARQEDITQAEATLKNAEDDLHRMENLNKESSVSAKQLDDARTRYILAQQTYDKLKRGLRPEEIEAARAHRDQAHAVASAIRKKINDAVVVSPGSGVITQKNVEEGEMVLPNGSLFRLSQLDKVHLIIYITEEELARIKLGQDAKISIDGEPNKTFPGRVIYISSEAEFTPKNVQTKEDRTKLVFGVKIEIPNPDQILKPGMPADALIETTPGI